MCQLSFAQGNIAETSSAEDVGVKLIKTICSNKNLSLKNDKLLCHFSVLSSMVSRIRYFPSCYVTDFGY
jgi:hypothetical protein